MARKQPKPLTTIADLQPDPKNANRGTVRGRAMLETSLERYGAGRSILADRNGVIIAGNKTLEAAAEKNFPVRIVQTDGKELVVVQRTDLDMKDKAAKALAIADNRVAEVNLQWDGKALEELKQEIDLDVFFDDAELNAIIREGSKYAGLSDDGEPAEPIKRRGGAEFVLAIVLTKQQYDRWFKLKTDLAAKDDTDTLLKLMERA